MTKDLQALAGAAALDICLSMPEFSRRDPAERSAIYAAIFDFLTETEIGAIDPRDF